MYVKGVQILMVFPEEGVSFFECTVDEGKFLV